MTTPNTTAVVPDDQCGSDEPLSYGSYLRVPELLSLQSPLGRPPVQDEMLFIILQQSQELWFKQALHDLRAVIACLRTGEIPVAVRYLDRINRIFRVLSEELEVMETLQPAQFARFRRLLTPSSGFESLQFRELELASGLDDEHFLRLVRKILDLDAVRASWPVTLRQAFLETFGGGGEDVTDELLALYADPDLDPPLYALAEALSEYEVRLNRWRFNHVKVVERAIGNRSQGTGGSPGTSYLERTVDYRFFPELWEARNRLMDARPG
jgi:tryptophan 2,3-dioxygenase